MLFYKLLTDICYCNLDANNYLYINLNKSLENVSGKTLSSEVSVFDI